jgi:lipopolysaccharide export system protein LptA
MNRVLLLAALLLATHAHAQRNPRSGSRPCTVTVGGDRFGSSELPSGNTVTYWGGRVTGTCGPTMRVKSDSAEVNQDAGVATLIGRAQYSDNENTVDADRIRYFEGESRVEATGNVRARSKSGNTLNVNQLNYYRETPSRNYIVVEGVGRSRLVIRDSTNVADSAATTIESNRIRSERDSLFYAGGNVVITRPDMRATADSAATMSSRRHVRLIGGKPTMVGRGGNAFNITGTVLDVFGKESAIERLLAQGKAEATSDSLHLVADTIDIGTTGEKIDRVALRGPGRVKANTPGRDIVADRIDLSMPGQQLRELVAIGRALVTTRADTTIKTTDRDWIEGDTVIARFDSLPKADSAKQPPLRTLLARGAARSFYHLAPKEATDSLPTINYVTGMRIDAGFTNGAVSRVEVFGDVRGMTLEPARDTTATRRREPASPPTRRR